ncbi:MAG: hypothetical protein FWG15_02935 [Propionibacteriaceae bacterium]|nr:hypothetical protein [Propionibacteriaceae bacterium]
MIADHWAVNVYRELSSEIARQGLTMSEVASNAGLKQDRLYFAMKNNTLKLTEFLAVADALGTGSTILIDRARTDTHKDTA